MKINARLYLLALLLPLTCYSVENDDGTLRTRLLSRSQHLQLAPQELRWISDHPTISVVSLEDSAPVSYIDKEMNYRGISADLLTFIRIRTGLTFLIHSVKDLKAVEADMADGRALLAAGISQQSLPALNYSRPWLTSDYVLLTRSSQHAPLSLDKLSSLVVAVRTGSIARRILVAKYPNLRLINANTFSHALDLLQAGHVDAVVANQANAEFQLRREARSGIKIACTLDFPPLMLAFATPPGQPELLSIVNKAMASLSKNDLDLLGSSWRYESGESWSNSYLLLMRILVLLGIIIVLSLEWGISLRRQVQRRAIIQCSLNNQLTFIYAMMDAMPYPVVLRDLQGKLINCNSRYLEEVNLTREEVSGQLITVLPISSVIADSIHRDYENVLKTGKPMMRDRELSFSQMKKRRMVSQWIVPFYDSKGHISGVYSGWVDITERQMLLQVLHESSARAEAANQAKTLFLSTMSHEIRTPLNAIIGILELQIKKNRSSQQLQPILEVAHDAAKNLLDVVGDTLDIARIESGRMTLKAQPAELVDLTRSVVRIFESGAAQKNLSLQLSIHGEGRRWVMIEPLRFKQILTNLLSNAIKFTSQGEVRVRLSHQVDAGGQVEVRLTVTDSGVGISAKDQQKLFQPFQQLAGSEQISRQGTGLGLYICRTLCEMMQGEVTIVSEAGAGTTVNVLLRLLQARQDEQAAFTEPTAEKQVSFIQQRILIVDDYLPNRILLRHQLQFLGHEVIEAEQGEQALALWRAGHHYDVMLIDYNMPVMDGFTLARTIRKEALLQDKPPILLLGFTADAQPEMVQRCLIAGMDGCLFKPTTLDELAQLLQIKQNITVKSSQLDGLQLLENIAWLTGADHSLNQTFLQQLEKSLHENCQQLQQALAHQQIATISDEAHKIKGLARLVHSDELHIQCTALEQACQIAAWEPVFELTIRLIDRLQQFEHAVTAALSIHHPASPTS